MVLLADAAMLAGEFNLVIATAAVFDVVGG
jgi:hypothetical protein